MQPESKNRVPLRIDTLAAYIEQKLDREVAVLDLLVGAEVKGQGDPNVWRLLHEAARRDSRQTELGAAYERLAKDKKIKTLTPASQAEVFVNAGTFFADVASDPTRAADLFERALAASPGHVLAFERLERILIERQELARLVDLYAAAAPARGGGDKSEQLALLRRAIDIATAAGDDDRIVKLYQQILKVEPGDAEARRALEDIYARAGRFAELAKMLEAALAAVLPVNDEEALSLRSRLIRLYTTELKETERALVHVEEVLRVDPAREPAFEVAEQLLGNKTVAARAAAALAGVYDRMGDAAEAARMMAIEVDHLRGPKRIEAQKRLASLILQRIGDIHGAFGHFEAIVTIDPSDEEYRQKYRELASVLDKRLDATRVLTRAIMASKEPSLKARINAELGELFIEIGDAKKARAAFQGVLDAGGDDGAVLRATRAMAKLAESAGDTKALAALLERLTDTETDEGARVSAAERLAGLYEGELGDLKAAAVAYKKLIGTKGEAPALRALERLYSAAGSDQELAGVLERRAAAEKDAGAGRSLAFRAAEIRTTKLGDRAAALDAWRRYIATYGPDREAHARMFPLLEQEKRWDELAERLAREAELVSPAERAGVLAKVGQIKSARLSDERGALEAYRDALAIDPAEKTSRSALEKALASGPQQLFAASVLEPVAKSEGATALRVRLLEVRGSLSATADERLRALAEATSLAETELGDVKRALEIAGRALRSAVEGSTAPAGGALDQPSSDPVRPEEVKAWVERVERLGASDAAGRAEALSKALGEREITSPLLADLARRAGEALTASGEPARALAILKKALAFSPSSPELLEKVDALLREQGDPEERIALYRAALERAEDASGRGKALHAIGAIELREQKNAAAAIETYRRAVANDPEDKAARMALVDAHAAAGPSQGFLDDIEQALPRVSGADRDALRVRMAEVALALGGADKAAAQFAALLAEGVAVPAKTLDAIEELARARDDVELLYAALERRVAAATEPREEAQGLERLGELALKRKDAAAAALAWKKAAEIAERAAAFAEEDAEEAAWAARLYERVLTAAPDDAEAIERLAELYRSQGAWEKLPVIHAARIRGAKDGPEAVRRLLAFGRGRRGARGGAGAARGPAPGAR
jgi:tetratricopeptide (TPR) repeat protein